jgi:hypothetical protein
VAVKREGALEPIASHQDERDAVGKADSLVGELRKDINRLLFIVRVRPKDRQRRRVKQGPGPVGGEGVGGSPAEQGERLVENEAAREAAALASLDLGLGSPRPPVVAVLFDVSSQEGPGVDEDHFSSS